MNKIVLKGIIMLVCLLIASTCMGVLVPITGVWWVPLAVIGAVGASMALGALVASL